MTDHDLRERVAAAMWNSRGNGDWKDTTNTALIAIYRSLADAALAEMGGVREAATHWAITSPSGMHIGLWDRYETAKKVFDNEVNGGKLTPMRTIAEGKDDD